MSLIGLAYISKLTNSSNPLLSVDRIMMHTGWTGYLMLSSRLSIHGSGRVRIGLGDVVGSLIVQGGLQS
jgi:hypothetical protein